MSFLEAIAPFKEVSAAVAEEKIAASEKFILFVGRPSCPYCQRFAPKLSRVAQANEIEIHFLNSENASDLAGITEFRSRHHIPTVPGLLVADKGEVKVVCDSSLSEEAILAFID